MPGPYPFSVLERGYRAKHRFECGIDGGYDRWANLGLDVQQLKRGSNERFNR